MRNPRPARGLLGTRPEWFGLLCAGALAWSGPAQAASYTLELRGPDGSEVEHAVVTLHAPEAPAALAPESPAPRAVMDQIDGQFDPHVLAVRAGTLVSFPNSDQVRHHVYSFSAAKRFELKLYKGVPANPVLFDRSGVVVLGCNIHDHMLGYIQVVETPLFATTGADGLAQFPDLHPGRYRIEVWHPRMVGANPLKLDPLVLAAGAQERAALEIQVTARPARSHDDLTPLERKLRERTAP